MRKRFLVGIYCGFWSVAIAALVTFATEGDAFTYFLGLGGCYFLAGWIEGFLFAPGFVVLDPGRRKRHPFRTSLATGITAAFLAWPLIGFLSSVLPLLLWRLPVGNLLDQVGFFLIAGLLTSVGWLVNATIVLFALALTAWDERNKKGFAVARAALALVFSGGAVTGMFFVNQKRIFVHEMEWQYGSEVPERFAPGPVVDQHGEKGILLTFSKYPNFFMTEYSNKMVDYLASLGTRTVPVTLEVVYDFGRRRRYSVLKVGDVPYEKLMGTSGGGTGVIGNEGEQPSPFDLK